MNLNWDILAFRVLAQPRSGPPRGDYSISDGALV
jgi:hypothetical protein